MEWVGVYIAITRNLAVTQLYAKLGGTENKSRRHRLVQKIRTLDVSVRPDETTRWLRCAMTKAVTHLGGSDRFHSVIPK